MGIISEKRTLPTDSSRYKQKYLSDKGIVRYAVLTLTGVAINSGHAGNSGNRVIGLASQSVMKNFEAENFARDLEQIDHF